MIGDISVKTNLYLVSGYTDMRRSIDGLCATIQSIASQSEMLGQKDAAIARLTEEISYLRKKLFGTSFEKRPDIDPNQLTFFDMEEGTEIPVADVEEIEESVVKEHTRQRKKKPILEE